MGTLAVARREGERALGGSKLDVDGRLTDAGRGRVEEEVAGGGGWSERFVSHEGSGGERYLFRMSVDDSLTNILVVENC